MPVCRLVLILLMAGVGCNPDEKPHGPRYSATPRERVGAELVFAVHPWHNPAELTESYGPLMDYLSARLPGHQLRLEASRDYEAFERKIEAKTPDILLPNPYQTLLARAHGYTVIATAGDNDDFRGLVLVRKDSGIRSVTALKGRTVSYPAPTALAACIMPQFYLQTHGVDVQNDLVNSYVGSQGSAIMNVYLGLSEAAATWPPPWRTFQAEHPEEARSLMVLFETPSLINNSVMVRRSLPVGMRATLLGALLDLEKAAEGRRILEEIETAGFWQTTDGDYDQVEDYLTQFEELVGPVKEPR